MFTISQKIYGTDVAVKKFKRNLQNRKKTEYVNTATLHGFTRVCNTQRWERGFWLTVLCISTLSLGYGVFHVVWKYYRYEVIQDNKQILDEELELPAVTISNNKRYKIRYEPGVPQPDNIKTAFSSEFYNFTKSFPQFCEMNALLHCTLESNFVTTGENASFVTWNNYGQIKQILPGINNGLRLIIYLNASDQSYNSHRRFKVTNSLLVVLHFAEEYPAITFDGFDVTPGMKTRVMLIKKKIVRLPWPYSKCREALYFEGLPRKTRYSVVSCIELCFLRYGVERCGEPIQPQYTGFIPESVMKSRNSNMTENEVRECYYILQYDFLKNHQSLCDCPTPCTEVIYSKTFHSVPIHRVEIERHQRVTLGEFAPTLSLDEVRESIFEIDIFYPQVGYTLIEERPAYSIPEALADFGGQLGLAVGASALSIIEVIVIMLLHLFPPKPS